MFPNPSLLGYSEGETVNSSRTPLSSSHGNYNAEDRNVHQTTGRNPKSHNKTSLIFKK